MTLAILFHYFISLIMWNKIIITDVVIHQHSRKLLKMDKWMSETCWAHNKWNKIASVIKLVFHSSAIDMEGFIFAISCIMIQSS